MSSEHRTKITLCPACGFTLDSASDFYGDAKPPEAGDISVCLKCANIMVFTEDLGLRALTKAEQAEVYKDEGVRKAIAAVILNSLTKPWPKPPKGS